MRRWLVNVGAPHTPTWPKGVLDGSPLAFAHAWVRAALRPCVLEVPFPQGRKMTRACGGEASWRAERAKSAGAGGGAQALASSRPPLAPPARAFYALRHLPRF